MYYKRIHLEELNCSICQEKFANNSLSPRILNCGHTFCTGCLKLVIRGQSLCPDCREEITETDIEKIPVVYIIKQISESIEFHNEMQEQLSPLQDCNESECESLISLTNNSDPFPSVGTCPAHRAPQQFYCKSCCLWICGSCAYLNHRQNTLPIKVTTSKPEACDVITAVKQFESLRDAQLKKLLDQMQELKTAIVTVGNFAELLKEEMSNIKSYPRINNSDKTLVDLYDQIFKNVVKKKKDLEISLEQAAEFKNKLDVNSLGQLYLSSRRIDNLWTKQIYPQLEASLVGGIFSSIINKVPHVLMRVNDIIVSLRRDDKHLYSYIRFENDYMIVSSLIEGPAEGTHIIPFQEIKRNCKNMKTFFRLSRQGTKLGTVEIKLFDNRRAEQFVMLCTGEKGPSYKWTKFFASGGLFTQYLAGGDYERNDGTGGAQIIDDVGDPYGNLMENGIVCGEISFNKSQLAQFKIFYNVGSSPFAHCPIGIVVRGLPLVKDIAQQDFTKVYIEECGIMIPMRD